MKIIKIIFPAIMILLLVNAASAQKKDKRPPNIIFILSDDLSWGDLGAYGQKKIKTPNIDRIAREGMKFTQAYAGNAVCAPSRSCLMEGKHPGHARIRSNSYKSYRESLREGDFTVAMLLKQAGYKTGLFGKWGLSNYDQPGIPTKMGFDEFYGYLNQQHAHCYYPEFLYHNEERIFFPENGEHYKLENYQQVSPYNSDGKALPVGINDPLEATYSFDWYSEHSLEFIKQNKNKPFYLNLSYTIPHGDLIVPDLGVYKDKDWPIVDKEWAAMITRMDTEVGKLLDLINELGLDDNTIIFFASDNGTSAYQYEKGTSLTDFFNLASPTRGRKGDSFDGAFHVPALVRWPGHIAPNQVSDQVWAFWDFLPTVAELTETKPPSDIDGISILPALLGKGVQKQHEFLYWEYNGTQAIRYGKWFARKPNAGKIELYDLIADPQQAKDMGSENPDIIKKIDHIIRKEHTPSDVWPSPGETEAQFQKRMNDNQISQRPDNLSVY